MKRNLGSKLGLLLTAVVMAYAMTACVVVDDDYECDNGEWLYEAGDVSCDGYVDCLDGSDEWYCSNDYICDDGEVLIGWGDISCDAVVDCYDGSDEWDCGCDPAYDYECADGECLVDMAGMGVDCDAVADCDDFSDELACDGCAYDEVYCEVMGAFDCAITCDGYDDCDDGMDEDTLYCGY